MKVKKLLPLTMLVLILALSVSAADYRLLEWKPSVINKVAIIEVKNPEEVDKWALFQFNITGTDIKDYKIEKQVIIYQEQPVYEYTKKEIDCSKEITLTKNYTGQKCYEEIQTQTGTKLLNYTKWVDIGAVKDTSLTTKTKLWNEYYLWAKETYIIRVTFTTPVNAVGDWNLNPSGWFNTSWNNRLNYTITRVGSTTLTNYPQYLNISFKEGMISDFDDVRFVMGDTELDYDRDNYVASNYMQVWVRIPTFDDATEVITMYYNNSEASYGYNPTGVWDNEYLIVYHLGNQSNTSRFDDSTQYGNHLIRKGVNDPPLRVGVVGYGMDAQNGDNCLAQNTITLGLAKPLTIEMFADADGWDVNDKIVAYTPGSDRWGMADVGGEFWVTSEAGNDDNIDTNTVVNTNLNYQVGRYNGTHGAWIQNNVVLLAKAQPQLFNGGDGTSSFYVGGDDGGSYFDGLIDEVRVSNTSRSMDYMNQTYRSVIDYGNVVSEGAVEYITAEAPAASNELPVIAEVKHVPSAADELTNFDCNATATDAENTSLVIEWHTYVDDVYITGNNASVTNNTDTTLYTVLNTSTAIGQVWNCSVRAFDGTNYSAFTSVALTITNSSVASDNCSIPTPCTSHTIDGSESCRINVSASCVHLTLTGTGDFFIDVGDLKLNTLQTNGVRVWVNHSTAGLWVNAT